MKSIFTFAVGLMLSSSMVMAQNAATVDQSGHNNETSVTQAGSNVITVTQEQTGASTNGGLHALITQDGSNTGTVFQIAVRESRAILNQIGTGNDASIEQRDYANDAEVRQSGAENEAHIFQAQGRFMRAEILQNGTGNVAAIDQHRAEAAAVTRSHAYITQLGAHNTAAIRQDLQQRARAEIVQSSDLNTASIRQEGASAIHTNHQALITQTGRESNYADLFQTGGSADGMQSLATILQDGTSNEVRGLNGVGSALQSGDAHVLNISQSGDYLRAFVEQSGTGHFALVTQSGSNSTATIAQSN